jgi:hypothetical protein
MSILGPGSLPALGIAASAAATQQRAAGLADRDKADQAQQKLEADQVRLANRDLDDSIETDFSHGQVSDRDSDGRLPWQRPDGSPTSDEGLLEEKGEKRRVCDPQGECGRTLDLEA